MTNKLFQKPKYTNMLINNRPIKICLMTFRAKYKGFKFDSKLSTTISHHYTTKLQVHLKLMNPIVSVFSCSM